MVCHRVAPYRREPRNYARQEDSLTLDTPWIVISLVLDFSKWLVFITITHSSCDPEHQTVLNNCSKWLVLIFPLHVTKNIRQYWTFSIMPFLPLLALLLFFVNQTSSRTSLNFNDLQSLIDNQLTESGNYHFITFVKITLLTHTTVLVWNDKTLINRNNLGTDYGKVWLRSLDQWDWRRSTERRKTVGSVQRIPTVAQWPCSIRVCRHHWLCRVADHAACLQ